MNAEMNALIFAIRNFMREKKVKYRDLTEVLGLSESSIKRVFSQKNLSVEQVSRIANYLGYSFFDLCAAAERKSAPSHKYTPAQDRLLGNSPLSMYIFVLLMFGSSLVDIEKKTSLSAREVLRELIKLDKANLIKLHPGNRVSVLVHGPFDLPKGGYLEKSLQNHVQVALDHFEKKANGLEKFEGLIHAREYYLPHDVYLQLKSELMELSLRYRQICRWMVCERKPSELIPVTLLLGADTFNIFEAVWRSHPQQSQPPTDRDTGIDIHQL